MKTKIFSLLIILTFVTIISTISNCSSENIVNSSDTLVSSSNLGIDFKYTKDWNIAKLNDTSIILYQDEITATSPNISISKSPKGTKTIDNLLLNYIDFPNLNDTIVIDSMPAFGITTTKNGIKKSEIYTINKDNFYKIMYSADTAIFENYSKDFYELIDNIKFNK